jgi:hypothetical protein
MVDEKTKKKRKYEKEEKKLGEYAPFKIKITLLIALVTALAFSQMMAIYISNVPNPYDVIIGTPPFIYHVYSFVNILPYMMVSCFAGYIIYKCLPKNKK